MSIRRFVITYLCLATLAFGATDFSKPLPSLALPDGRVLKNVTFANFTADAVLLRHAGGSAAIRYEFLPEAIRADVEARRPGGPRVVVPDETAAKTIELKGLVYLRLPGAITHKFKHVPVYAFAEEHLSLWDRTPTGPVKLPPPLAETVTNANGWFTMTLPADQPYFLFAQASRKLNDNVTELNEWRVPGSEIKKPDEVMLNYESKAPGYRPVEIQKQP